MQALPHSRVGLLFQLQRVAAIGEDRRPLRQHDRQPGAAGETGDEFQAFCRFWHIFAQMFVGAGDGKPVQPACFECGAQGG